MKKELQQLESAINELHESNDITKAGHSTLKFALEQVKNIAYEPVLASVNSELKETYLRRIRTANKMIDNPSTPEEQKQRLRTKVRCYKYFVVELER